MGLIGLLFNAVTFPGVVVNQVVQGVYEDKYQVPIERFAIPKDVDERDFQENPEAFVRPLGAEESPEDDERAEIIVNYESLEGYSSLFGLVLAPFFVTSILALVLFGVTAGLELSGVVVREDNPLLWLLIFYPGFAVAAHAFPNKEPTDALWNRSKTTKSLLRTIGYPLVALSKLMSLLRFLWIDAIYAIALYLLFALPLGLF